MSSKDRVRHLHDIAHMTAEERKEHKLRYHSKQTDAEMESQDNPPQGKQTDEESLTTILSVPQRTELTLLLAAATGSMREAIEDNFDASASLPPGMLAKLDAMTEDEKIMNASVDPGSVDVAAHDKERKALIEREKELDNDAMKEQKKAVLNYFDEWREAVILRVGEAVNSKKNAGKEIDESQHQKKTEKVPKADDVKVDSTAVAHSDVDSSTASLRQLYPPIKNALANLPEEKKTLILHSVLLLLLSLEHYSSYSRILLLYLTSSLQLPLTRLTANEVQTASTLLKAAQELSGDDEAQAKVAANASSRKWKVGIASVAGAAIVGITGGLAAPLVAAGIGSVMGGLGLGATAAAGYLGTVAGSTVIVGGLFGAYGGRMTGQMMDRYARQVEDFAFIPIRGDFVEEARKEKKREERRKQKERGEKVDEPAEDEAEEKKKDDAEDEKAGKSESAENRRLRVTVGISGWLTEKEEVVTPWLVVGREAEVFALRWELEACLNLGNSVSAMISSAAWGYAKKEAIKQTIFADMMAAMWPIGLLQVARLVDNPFSVAKSRADKAGEVLADALINRAQGERPVTLVGYSLGARLIYSCLMSLAKRKEFGLVESVVMMGGPCPSDSASWRMMRSVVAGRLLNMWSGNDYVLGFLYRTSSIQYGVAGLQKVEGVAGVENIDVSDIVTGHLRYRYLVGSLLKKIGFEDIDLKEVEREEEALRILEEEESIKNQIQEKSAEAKKYGTYYSKYVPNVRSISPTFSRSKKGDPEKAQNGTASEVELTEDEKEAEEAANNEVSKLEKDVQTKTQMSLLQRGIQYFTVGSASRQADQATSGATDQVSGTASAVGQGKPQDTATTQGKSYYQMATDRLGMGGSSSDTKNPDLKDPDALASNEARDKAIREGWLSTAKGAAGSVAGAGKGAYSIAASSLPSFSSKKQTSE